MWPFKKKEMVLEKEEIPKDGLIRDISNLLTMVDFEQPEGLVGENTDNERWVTLKLQLSLEFSRCLCSHFNSVHSGNEDLIIKNFSGALLPCVESLLKDLPTVEDDQYIKFTPPYGSVWKDKLVSLLEQDGVLWLEINYKICDKY